MRDTIFVIDDDALQLEMTQRILQEKHGYQVIGALGGEAAIEHFLLRSKPRPDLVLLDLIMPEISGVDVVKAIRRSDPNIPIVLLAPRDSHGMVMEAIRAGANDCLQKPANVQYLKLTIEKHLQREQMRAELERLNRYQQANFTFDDIIGQSDGMQRCLNQAREASIQAKPLLIEGEPGTGKELLARVIHSQSAKRNGRFAAVRCDKSSALLGSIEAWVNGETELPSGGFGAAEGGTLLLSNVAELPMRQQEALVKLQLSLSTQLRSPWQKVRLIATSSMSLDMLYGQGLLHEKLYHLLTEQRIALPPLRERGQDIKALASHYLQRYTATFPFSVRSIDKEGIALLAAQEWKGNVQELIHFVQRAAYYAHEPVLGAHIVATLLKHPSMAITPSGEIARPVHAAQEKGDYSLLTTLGEVKPFEQIEAEIIRFAIEHYRGKMTEVARKLGIGRSTLYRKMQDYNLRDVPAQEQAA